MLSIAGVTILAALMAVSLGITFSASDPDSADAVRARCIELLEPKVDRTAFAGAEVFGSSEQIAAAIAKLEILYWDHWTETRRDLDMIVYPSAGVDQCVMFDTLGYPVGQYVKLRGEESLTWWTTLRDEQGYILRQYTDNLDRDESSKFDKRVEPTVPGGAKVHGVDRTDGTLFLLYEAEVEPNREQLFIKEYWPGDVYYQNALISETGRLVSTQYRACVGAEKPCEYPWETNTILYDSEGIMVGWRYVGIDSVDETTTDHVKNDRGDWVQLWQTYDGERTLRSSRMIYYRD